MRAVVRALFVVGLVLGLASCSRQVHLQLGPLSLVNGSLVSLEVRVWNAATCPATATDASDPAHLSDVAVVHFYQGVRDAPAVGAVPSGRHAVSVLVRGSSCETLLYGCTPDVDFGATSTVVVTWSDQGGAPMCTMGYVCDGVRGSCDRPSSP